MGVIEDDSRYIVSSYRRFPVVLEQGRGARCFSEDGREYIDFTSGIGVNSLGYCDREWCDAVCRQAKTLQHSSNLYYTAPAVKLAKLLHETTGFQKALFCNSGAEANECAIKTARKYSFDKYGKDAARNRILCLNDSFHGRTVTTLSATGQDVFHNYFFPFTEGFSFTKANDVPAFLKAVSDQKICGVMLEFIQGEGGVNPLTPEFVKTVFDYCKAHDILVIADEVQTGIGRTGRLLAGENYGAVPNITTLAKGLGGGLPIGTVLFDTLTCDVLQPGDHGTTFGGNPVVCAGAYCTLHRISQPAFLKEVQRKGESLKKALLSMPQVAGVDGMGLMLGIRLKTMTASDAAAKCLDEGLLVLTAKEKIRLLPPLVITDDELERGISILKNVLS